MATKKKGDGSEISVHPEHRDHPDLRKLARALIEFARLESQRDQEAQQKSRRSGANDEEAAP